MMTDKEKLQKLLTDFGVKFSEDENGAILVEEDVYSKKVQAYMGFFASFVFDKQGHFDYLALGE